MESLDKLFGGPARLRLIRLFLFNPGTLFTAQELARRGNISIQSVRRELKYLLRAVFIKRRIAAAAPHRKGKRAKHKKQSSGFSFNANFPYLHPLRNLLIEATPLRSDILLRRLNRVGKLKLVVISGLLIQEPESRLDLLIVGDRLNKGLLDRTIHMLESEIGKELRYTVFESADFIYRLNVYDKLIRDVFDYRHQKILNRMDLAILDETYPQAPRQTPLDGATLISR